MESSTVVKDAAGRHFDLCDMPVGGMPCRVGTCVRDVRNRTISCTGDSECGAAGNGNGVCVGQDEGMGYCVCGRGFFCRDCSLHQSDLARGARCGRYITGGALCHSNSECSGSSKAGYCAAPRRERPHYRDESIFDRMMDRIAHVTSEDRPFCRCAPGRTCRRCEQLEEEVTQGTAACLCDAPRFEPGGGEYLAQLKEDRLVLPRVEVALTAEPWDAEYECQILNLVHHSEQNWTSPPWPSDVEAADVLRTNGTLLQSFEDGNFRPVVFGYRGRLKPDGNMTKDFVRVYAVAVPRPNTTWKMAPSEVVRSGLFVLSAAVRRSCGLAVVLVAVGMGSGWWARA